MAGLQADSAVVAGLAEAKRDEAIFGSSVSPQTATAAPVPKKKNSQDDPSVYSARHTEGSTVFDPNAEGRFPTNEELRTLRHVLDRVPWNAYCSSLYLHAVLLNSHVTK